MAEDHRHVHTKFGDYEVYKDAEAMHDPHGGQATNHVTESELATMQTAWNNVEHGQGLHITGNAHDVAEMKALLRDGMEHSSVFRHTVEDIGTDSRHTVDLEVGRHQPGTIGDTYATSEVDLSDIEQFAVRPTAGHHDAITRMEVVEHILEERNDGNKTFDIDHAADPDLARAQHALAPQTGGRFEEHEYAMGRENALRRELGQHAITDLTPTITPEDTGAEATWHMAGGGTEALHIDRSGDISLTEPPDDPASMTLGN